MAPCGQRAGTVDAPEGLTANGAPRATAMREVVRGGVNFKAFRKTPYHPYAQEEVVEITDGAGHKVNLNRHHVNQLRRSYEQEEQREQRADELWREDVSRPRGRARGRSRR